MTSSARPQQRSWHQPLAGAAAGVVTVTVCAPLDVAKVRMQLQDAIAPGSEKQRYSGLIGSLRTIYKEEGPRGFFRGYPTGLLTVPCFWSIYFSVYAQSKSYLGQHVLTAPAHQPAVHMLAAVSGAVATDVATNPLWVVRTRLISQHMHREDRGMPKYTGTLQAFQSIIRTEGFFALYKGLGASLLGTSHVAVQFPLYEYLKRQSTAADDGGGGQNGRSGGAGVEKVDLWRVVCASAVSKLVASTVTYPHEVLRSRLQDQRSTAPANASSSGGSTSARPPAVQYTGLIDACRVILRTEGVAGFYRGLSVNLVRVIPSTAVTFFTYEYLLDQLRQRERDREPDSYS